MSLCVLTPQDTKFERMLWKLEVAWWEATEPLLGGNGKGRAYLLLMLSETSI